MYVLNKELAENNISEQAEIMSDYEEHFRIGAEEGKTDEEIAAELGDPKELALSFCEASGVEEAPKKEEQESSEENVVYYTQTEGTKEQNSGSKWVIIVLVVLALIFVGFPLLGTLLSFLGTMASVSVGLVIAGIALAATFCALAQSVVSFIGALLLGLGTILLGVACGFLTAFAGIGLWKLCKWCWVTCEKLIKEA